MPPRTLIRNARSRPAPSRWMPDSLRANLLRFVKRLQGGAIIAVAAVLALILFSYSPQDASWNTAAAGPVIHNWLGAPGSYIADIIWQLFGAGGFLIAVILAAWGWLVATGRGLALLPWRTFAAVLAMFASAAGLAVLQPLVVSDGSGAWGGAFGKIIGQWSLSLLPDSWGEYALAPLMIIVTLGALYLAAALTLEEWHGLVLFMHSLTQKIAQIAIAQARRLWGIVRQDPRYLNDDGDGDEDGDEEEDEEEPEEKSWKPFRKPVEKPEAPQTKTIIAKRPNVTLVQRPAASAKQARLALRPEGSHILPPLDLLQWPEIPSKPQADISEEALEKNAKLLESVLADFGVLGQITKVSPGPVVTLYELEPSPGTRSSRVISLADDIARNMSAASVRVAVVPGRNVIGIELPNRRREIVYLRELLGSDTYTDYSGTLPLVLGKDIAGGSVITDLSRMPHLLIAGTTGSGKSVAINTMILSLIYRLPPEKCRFIMIDPKMLELSVYEGIPHLLAPVVTEPKKAIVALKWTVREMEERYRAMSKLAVRNIEGYNIRLREAVKNNENLMRTVQTGFDRDTGKPVYEEQPLDLTPLPYIVVIVDEMADLMIVAGKEIEATVQRLAQMARAAGIHLIMATQRPSVDIITGTIKANLPTRISFQVSSKIDSRTILNEQGAEQLLGQGDMLYQAGGGRVTRVHGPFVRDHEVESIVKFLKAQGPPEYLDDVTQDDENGFTDDEGRARGEGNGGNELYDKAVDLVLRERKASISFVQRHLQIGYNRAATLIERMERDGVISEANHVGKRDVLGRKPND
ncbi:MAG: DNA translocase FtsK 4TM domain-containing protein [Alphaproteobacteria bacterium]|nr:DNA translocase FtsK 4TM domain-containing protein [Alphaproteobacteria bacterium]